MKTLLGVDLEGTFQPAMGLCERLRFTGQEWLLCNAVAPVASYGTVSPPMEVAVGEAIGALEAAGHQAVSNARQALPDGSAQEFVIYGSAPATLMRTADEEGVDLIVVGSGHPRKGLLWMVGSVSRALGYGAKQSLLVSKQPNPGTGAVHAIFATDHSEYANSALERLISWGPKGFGRIDVLTAYEIDPNALASLKGATQVNLDFETWLHSEITGQCQRVAERLRETAPDVRIMVERGRANDVISKAMNTTKADLLIVAAQGHGFIDRLLIGSVSLHQLVAEPYPVLLMRRG